MRDGPRAVPPGNLLAFDFGTQRIGVAIGNSLSGQTRPLVTLDSAQGVAWDEIERLIAKWDPAALVVGLPLDADGSNQRMTQAAQRFGRRLAGRFGRPVVESDERFSSLAVDPDDARIAGIDAAAAALILRGWLASAGHQPAEAGV